MKRSGLLLVILALASTFEFPAISAEVHDDVRQKRIEEAARSASWLKLLHYRSRRILPGRESDVDSPDFFVSPSGKTDPRAELEAELRSFTEDSAEGDSVPAAELDARPRCRFPARWNFVRDRFPELLAHRPRCPGYERYRGNFDAEGVSLVFSSYYLNSPASAFGHSFLRLHRRAPAGTAPVGPGGSVQDPDSVRRLELLDLGFGYAADGVGGNPLVYSFAGIFGLTSGSFTALPYYYKVREYADSESRDLWSYRLNFASEELDRLMAHFWELGGAHLDYYYFSENCAYVILTVLEAAKPELTLTARLPYYVAPSHSIQIVASEPGFVLGTSYRESAWSRFRRSEKALSPEERREFQERAFEFAPPEVEDVSRAEIQADVPAEWSVEAKRRWFDAAIDYFDFVNSDRILRGDEATVRRKEPLLRARSTLGVVSGNGAPLMDPARDPARAHLPQRLSLGGGTVADGPRFIRIGFRPSLQDLLDPSRGYPDSAELEFGNASLRWELDSHRLVVEEFDLLRAESLSPIDAYQRSPSFRMQLSTESWRNRRCGAGDAACQPWFLRGGVGFARRLFEGAKAGTATFFGFLEGDVAAGAAAQPIAAGPLFGVQWRFTPDWALLLEAGHLGVAHWRAETRFSPGHDWSVGLSAARGSRPLEGELDVHFYF